MNRLQPSFGTPVTEWMRWFAWRPVYAADHGRVWLRRVHRRRIVKHSYLPPGGSDTWWQYAAHLPQKARP